MFSSTFGPWSLFTDLGLIFGLLLVGKFIRVKVKFIQQLFIPPSLIAGFLGLAMGPNGLGWLPFSNQLGTYSAILIALVFASLPLSSPKFSFKEVSGRVGSIWAYAQLGMLLQWSIVGLFGLIFVKMAAKKNETLFIKDFSELPNDLRTGLTPKEKREPAGMSTTSSISIDSLAFHLALVFFTAFIGYLLSQGVKSVYPKLELPVFSC